MSLRYPFLYVVLTGVAAEGAETSALPAGLPVFRHHSIVLDYQNLKYNPCNDVIIPSVIRAQPNLTKPLGRFYLYYAPHDTPGGICLAYADRLEGPWKEHEANPIIRRDWPPHYRVSHVSGPEAIWNEEEHKLFLYYHGENDVTRLASSTNGIDFQYEGAVVGTAMFDQISEASYARVFRHTIPGRYNRYIMLLMGNHQGTRNIYLAWSNDGRQWQPRRTPLLTPPPGTSQVAQAWYFPWQGKHYLIYHAHEAKDVTYASLHISEVDTAFEHPEYLSVFYDRTSFAPDNVAQMSPCLVTEGSRLYLFTNIGPRLNQKIALAVAEIQAQQAGPTPPATVQNQR